MSLELILDILLVSIQLISPARGDGEHDEKTPIRAT